MCTDRVMALRVSGTNPVSAYSPVSLAPILRPVRRPRMNPMIPSTDRCSCPLSLSTVADDYALLLGRIRLNRIDPP